MESLTAFEMELLKRLWDLGPTTVRELALAVYQSDSDSKTASVQKLLGRMQEKGYVSCNTDVRPRQFSSKFTRDEYLQAQLEELARRHCDGKLMPLATALVQTKGFTKRQRQQLRRLIDELFPREES